MTKPGPFLWTTVLALCSVIACTTQGPKGDTGTQGAKGDPGSAGPPGTFSGFFDGGVTFAGDINLGSHRTVITYSPSGGGAPSSISTNGLYCGSSTATTGSVDAGSGGIGYRGAKILCEQACSAAPAHMCSANEIIQSLQLGVFGPQPSGTLLGWYSTGASSPFSDNPVITDCVGWGLALSSVSGHVLAWGALGVPNPNSDTCDQSHPILCCE